MVEEGRCSTDLWEAVKWVQGMMGCRAGHALTSVQVPFRIDSSRQHISIEYDSDHTTDRADTFIPTRPIIVSYALARDFDWHTTYTQIHA